MQASWQAAFCSKDYYAAGTVWVVLSCILGIGMLERMGLFVGVVGVGGCETLMMELDNAVQVERRI